MQNLHALLKYQQKSLEVLFKYLPCIHRVTNVKKFNVAYWAKFSGTFWAAAK